MRWSVDRWEDEGPRPLHEAWRGLVTGISSEIVVEVEGAPIRGVVQDFGMVLRTDAGERLVPLSTRLETPAAAAGADKPRPRDPPGRVRYAGLREPGADRGMVHLRRLRVLSSWTAGDLTGKARQAFANGWLGVETLGRVTFVAVTPVEPAEVAAITLALAQHFVAVCGAPSGEAARGVAEAEIAQMAEHCDGCDANAPLTVQRELGEAGMRETCRTIVSAGAEIDILAIHGTPERRGERWVSPALRPAAWRAVASGVQRP